MTLSRLIRDFIFIFIIFVFVRNSKKITPYFRIFCLQVVLRKKKTCLPHFFLLHVYAKINKIKTKAVFLFFFLRVIAFLFNFCTDKRHIKRKMLGNFVDKLRWGFYMQLLLFFFSLFFSLHFQKRSISCIPDLSLKRSVVVFFTVSRGCFCIVCSIPLFHPPLLLPVFFSSTIPGR